MPARILVVGATGALGGSVTRLLARGGPNVRALVRDPARRRELDRLGVDVAIGDMRDPASLAAACADVTHVITTANSFLGKGANASSHVDLYGNRNLVDAARGAGVERFVFVSADNATPDSTVDFFRYKAQTEEYLRATDIDYVIIRPAAFMDVWAHIVAGNIAAKGVATVFGAGDNPINFVARDDVADFIARIAVDPSVTSESVVVPGPENLTLLQVVEKFEHHLGKKAKRKHVPVVAMKVLSLLLKPVQPVAARMMGGGVLMATQPLTRDAAAVTRRFPWYKPRTLDDWLAKRNS
jgi:uncharacterized protein YbjT (DUF2867 family)